MKTLFAITMFFALAGFLSAQDAQAPASASPAQPAPAQQGSGSGQSTVTSNGPGQGSVRIAPGSVIPVQLTKTVDAKKAKPGEEVQGKVTGDLKSSSGEVIVPKDTKVMGKITEAQPRTKEQKESQLAIAFDHAVLTNGSQVALPMSIQAIIAPSYLNPNNPGANNDNASQPQQQGGGAMPATSRSGNMGGPPTQPSTASSAPGPDNSQAPANSHPPITGKTEGVLGMQNVSLSATTDASHGSVITSDKSNVKLESGTLMLLRVNQ
jgi:hypothetical protein